MSNGKKRDRPHHDVMVSSTYKDLKSHRKAVRDAISELGLFPQAMELDSASPENLIASSLSMVRAAQAYVGLIGHRYGNIPGSPDNPKRLSLTEMEYEEADERGLPIYMFIMSKEHLVLLVL